jgi:DNA invertase Pin-like site-specific DNA recombinase
MLIGYARVSTKDQDTALQEDALRKAGVERIFLEKASGAREDRPELTRVLDMARQGDVIVVWRLDRLARSIRHLIEIAGDLQKRGVHLKSLSDAIDTSTASGELHFHMLAALAQFERSLTRERVNAGLKVAREAGRIGGRPKVSDDKLDHARALIAGGMGIKAAAKMAGVSRSSIYRTQDVSKTSRKRNGTRRGFETSFATQCAAGKA